MKQEILHIMPVRLRESMAQRLQEERKIEEIRIRIGQPIELRYAEKSIWLPYRVNAADVEEMLTFISQYSLYAYEEEIRQGYLTIEGGNRIGFAGQVRLLDGQVSRMTNIRFLNIRKGLFPELSYMWHISQIFTSSFISSSALSYR